MTNHPTPATLNNPATSAGAINDATPGLGGAVTYQSQPGRFPSTTNQMDGNPVVVNATLPGHQLASGIVVREVQPNADGKTSTIQNWDEGNGSLQGPRSGMRTDINGVWKGQTPPNPKTMCNAIANSC